MFEVLRGIVFFIGATFTNPVVPDFGLQFAAACAIGAVLPKSFINPMNELVLRLPLIGTVVQKFEKVLKRHEGVRTMVPRIISGYMVTYAIGFSAMFLSVFL